MAKKEKVKKHKRKKELHLRFFLVLLAFLIETSLLILLLMSPILFPLYETSYYFLLVLLALIVVNFVLGTFIVNTKDEIDYKFAWMSVCFIFPVLGPILYLLFAHKVTTKRYKNLKQNRIKKYFLEHKKENNALLEEIKNDDSSAYKIAKYLDYCGFSAYKNTEYTYFESGEKGFPQIIEDLKSAKKYIFLEFFIIDTGEMYDTIYEILVQKVKEGVEVYFIYDDFGAANTMPSYLYKKARKDGINCYTFNRISPTINIRQNNRDHRKIIVIDGVIGYTGGANLADEYINKIVRFGYWKDNFLRIEGEAVDGLIQSFIIFFAICSKTKVVLDYEKYSYFTQNDYKKNKVNNEYVVPMTDMPYDVEAVTRNVYLKMINEAKDYILLSTPYLVPDNELSTALINAAKSGIKVKIITPGVPDKKMVYQVTRSYYATFLLHGIEIYEYTPGFNHEKAMVVDDKMAYSGTCNFDYRSLYLNFEDGLFLINNKDILKMRDSLLEMISKSKKQETDKYVNCSIFRRWFWSFLRVFSSLF